MIWNTPRARLAFDAIGSEGEKRGEDTLVCGDRRMRSHSSRYGRLPPAVITSTTSSTNRVDS